MRRWLLIFLLFLLPLQFSWAASATYCQHERDTRTQHWGHHEHPADHAADAGQQDNGSQPSASFGDCAVCHFGHAQHAVAALAEPLGTAVMAHRPRAMPSESFVSHISEVPVRPARTLAA